MLSSLMPKLPPEVAFAPAPTRTTTAPAAASNSA